MSLLITVSLFFKQGFRRLWHLSVDWSFVDTWYRWTRFTLWTHWRFHPGSSIISNTSLWAVHWFTEFQTRAYSTVPY